MSTAAYTRFEVLRTFRNRRFFIFSLGVPAAALLPDRRPNRDEHDFGGTGIDAPLYFMVGLAAFGTMNAMLAVGARIAAERSVGWNRQLRLTPLTARAYFRAKVLTGYLTALVTIVLLYAAGASLGVRCRPASWIEMTVLILVGLIPFAALGIIIGHLVNMDSIGPVIGGATALLGLLGGVWFPIPSDGALHDIAQVLPSYWLVQASHIAVGGGGLGRDGLARRRALERRRGPGRRCAYRRDTQRY